MTQSHVHHHSVNDETEPSPVWFSMTWARPGLLQPIDVTCVLTFILLKLPQISIKHPQAACPRQVSRETNPHQTRNLQASLENQEKPAGDTCLNTTHAFGNPVSCWARLILALCSDINRDASYGVYRSPCRHREEPWHLWKANQIPSFQPKEATGTNQLIPPDENRVSTNNNKPMKFLIPCLNISDYPKLQNVFSFGGLFS